MGMTKNQIIKEGVLWGLWAGYEDTRKDLMRLTKQQLILHFLLEMKKFENPRF